MLFTDRVVRAGGLTLPHAGTVASSGTALSITNTSSGRAGEFIWQRPDGLGILNIAMVTGDFDLSGIGTVTHVEGDRVYGFGHPMFSLGAYSGKSATGQPVFGSMNDYYKELSYGNFKVQGKFVGW